MVERQQPAGAFDHRQVDELAFQAHRVAAGLLERAHHGARPAQLVFGRCEAALDGLDLVRMDAELCAEAEGAGIPVLLKRLGEIGVDFKDLETSTSTLEDIFVGLIGRAA